MKLNLSGLAFIRLLLEPLNMLNVITCIINLKGFVGLLLQVTRDGDMCRMENSMLTVVHMNHTTSSDSPLQGMNNLTWIIVF